MRATPSPLPRISWTSPAIGSTATRYLPTPQIMLAMGILGGGAVGVVLVCASAPSHDDSSTSAHDSAAAGSGGSYEDPTRAMDVTVAGFRAIDALHLHHRRRPIIIQHRQFSMPTTISPPIMNPLLATSSSSQRNKDYNNMLATSDASAERSASMAAAAQMNSDNYSSFQNSNNSSTRRTNITKTQEGMNSTTTANHVNRPSHPPIRSSSQRATLRGRFLSGKRTEDHCRWLSYSPRRRA